MISRFFRSKAPRSAGRSCSIPEGRRVYAVGDIHGCADLLDDLIAQIDADDAARGAAETTVIFLGDIVDRGPGSAAVIDRLIGYAAARATCASCRAITRRSSSARSTASPRRYASSAGSAVARRC
ncbi:metallophosphoesterase [Sphingomonas sp. Ant20]|uniref:metallophosphoesterase n=1 Tax=Sphingomonas sp. Ant20 TaxID=104605 RepID=UPI000AB7660D